MEIDKHLENLKIKHINELYFKDIETRYYDWIKNVDDKIAVNTLNKLFYNIKFYSKIELKKVLKEKIEIIGEENGGLNNVAIIPLAPKEGRFSGANELISLIKEIDREEQYNDKEFLPSKNTILNDLKYIRSNQIVVIVDDISGSGGTLSKYIKNNIEVLVNNKIIFLFIGVTKQAKESFREIQNEYSTLNLNLTYEEEFEKVSSIGFLTEDEYSQLKNIEESLWKTKNNRFVLGYNQSELLIVFSHNIPNNTVSNLWHKSEENPPWNNLFKRFSISRKDRKHQNYTNKKRVK